MGIKEDIEARLRRIFPERVGDLDRFVQLVRERGYTSVEAHMTRKHPRFGTPTRAVGTIGEFEFFNRYTAGTLVLEEHYEGGKIFGSERGFGDAIGRDKMWNLLAITALNRLAGVRGNIPGIRTTLFIEGAEVPQEMIQSLRKMQTEQSLTPLTVIAKR